MSDGQHPAYLWWNGEQRPWADATVHVTDLGWSTVGAVFEGIRGYWDEQSGELYVFRLAEHLDRLARSSKLVRLGLKYSKEELTAAVVNLLRANDSREDTYIRPLVYTGNTTGKRFSQIGGDAEVLINTHPMPSHLLTGVTERAKVSSWTRISDNVMPPRIKNLSNYRNGMLAGVEARLDGYGVALMINPQGKVAEAPGACVMLVSNGVVITPDATSGILESITLDTLKTLVREELGLRVEERAVDRTELYTADEVFTCGTAAEITPIVEIDRYEMGDGRVGQVTSELERIFHDILRGRESHFAHWRTPVGVAVPA